MAGNSSLSRAAHDKNDEFYTRLPDIEKELNNYLEYFKDKIILCNCDDPFESNFFKYFVLNFNRFGLKKLIATCYATSPIMGKQLKYYYDSKGFMRLAFGDEPEVLNTIKRPYKAIVTQVYDKTGDGGVDMFDIAELFKSHENKLVELEGDGDFRSEECLALLDEADIVVTNPPFSLFKQYVSTLVEHQKKFIIIGNQSATKYKEIFPLIMDNKIWLGNNNPAPKAFYVPLNNVERKNIKMDEDGKLIASFGNICWFTNLDVKHRHEELILVKRYSQKEYPFYDNYNAIEVSKIVNIPCDYEGIMGVPISFFGKFNPDQFEIFWQASGNTRASAPAEVLERLGYKPSKNDRGGCCLINGKRTYDRVFIRNKHPEQPKERKL